jgi:hypothetical protein
MLLKGKRISEMSNAELKALNERLQLEKQYKELTKLDVSPARKFVTDLLVDVGKQTAKSYIQKYGVKGLEGLTKQSGSGTINRMMKSKISKYSPGNGFV